MIEIDNVDVYGFDAAIRGMRNPMNNYDKSDSFQCYGTSRKCENCNAKLKNEYGSTYCTHNLEYVIGKNDLDLMKRLVKAGTDHSKFMRMINVTMDITAPMYWWVEADTYKIGTVRNSCSKMHKIHSKEITVDDFSFDYVKLCDIGRAYIEELEKLRKKYVERGDKKYWYALIQLLPSSYNQRATVQLNYQVLRNIYHPQKSHELNEWKEFYKWIEILPYSELITTKN